MVSKNQTSIVYQFYPKSKILPSHLVELVEVFIKNQEKLSTSNGHKLSSNDILALINRDLMAKKYEVEVSKSAKGKIRVPVLFGKNNMPEKAFEVDAYQRESKTIVEVEAGRGVTNYQFLKDFFEAMIMVDIDYLVIAVRQTYRTNKDFETVMRFFDVFYSSGKVRHQLKGVLIIGY